jgi:hypothetical protein
MLDALHGVVRIEARPDVKECEILNDAEVWKAVLQASPKYRAALSAPTSMSAENRPAQDDEFLACVIHQARQQWQGQWTNTPEQVIEKARDLAIASQSKEPK